MFGLMGVARMSGRSGGAVAFPQSLFTGGRKGLIYEPWDFASMFQDSAGSTAVTATTQPVGKINDKSGNGNHATQATAPARMTLQQDGGGKYYLACDGVDDFLATAAIDFSASDEMTVVVALERPDTSTLIVAELSNNVNDNDGTFFVVSGANEAAFYTSRSRGTDVAAQSARWLPDDGAEKAIITATHDISGDLSRIRRNGVYGTDSTTEKGSGNFGNFPLYIGSRGGASLFFNGSIYGLLVIDRVLTADELAAAEAYFADKSGVTL